MVKIYPAFLRMQVMLILLEVRMLGSVMLGWKEPEQVLR
jgi:hypothetical protein